VKLRLLVALATALLPGAVFGGAFPELVLPQGVGVNIHFIRGHAGDLDMMAAAGFRFARMDLAWAATERVKGRYDWSAYDDLTAHLLQRGIRPYYILDYSNPLYESGDASPQHPASVAAFARWAAATATHYQGKLIIWEIWNEPNGGFWKPHPDVAQYTALALPTCKAIRSASVRISRRWNRPSGARVLNCAPPLADLLQQSPHRRSTGPAQQRPRRRPPAGGPWRRNSRRRGALRRPGMISLTRPVTRGP
jgi:Cellulase (glycosyl hydrolase family 5)